MSEFSLFAIISTIVRITLSSRFAIRCVANNFEIDDRKYYVSLLIKEKRRNYEISFSRENGKHVFVCA